MKTRFLALLLAILLLPATPAIATPANDTWDFAEEFLENTVTLYSDYGSDGSTDSMEWLGFDLALYDIYADSASSSMTVDMSRRIVNAAIDALTAEVPAAGQVAKYALILKGMGIDPDQLTDKNNNLVEASKVFVEPSPDSDYYIYDAPLLLAAHANELITINDLGAVFTKIEAMQGGGLFPYESWPNYNVTGQLLTALALFTTDGTYGTRAQAIINTSVGALATEQGTTGGFDGAYNEGWVLAGLAANGVALDPDFTAAEGDLLDALLSDGNLAENNAGFISTYAGGAEASAYDTAHGLVGLLAEGMRRKLAVAYNCFDLSARASESASYYTTPVTPPASGSDSSSTTQISVTFHLQGLDEDDAPMLWVSDLTLRVAERATVATAISNAFRNLDGYSQTGASAGYVSKVVSPTRTLSEKQSPWSNSGWMYLVNGEAPSTGISSYRLTEGDDILLYFSTDYTVEEPLIDTTDPQTSTTNVTDFTDLVADAWYTEGVNFVISNGYMTGESETLFAPEETLTRAMAVTVLYRLAGEPEVTGTLSYTDAEEHQWYSAALLWAESTGLATGYGNGLFGLEDTLTCEQIMVMLHRFALLEKLDITADDTITISAATSDWAVEAMTWATHIGIYDELGNETLTPQSLMTRAQLAVILLRWTDLK